MQILTLIRSRFEQALTGWVENPSEPAQRVSLSREPQLGDYQANIAMPLAKPLGLKPLDVASKLCERLKIEDICEPPEIAGPGFINLKLRDQFIADQLSKAVRDERFGIDRCDPKTYVIDYSAPNVAKPMHVGHIRSTVIGDALTHILRFLGHRVISDNHLGDWGTQFGMVIYGYKHFVNESALEAAPVAELSRLYRLVQQIIGYQEAKTKLAKAQEQVVLATSQVEKLRALSSSDSKNAKSLKSAVKELDGYQDTLRSIEQKIAAVEGDSQLAKLAAEHTDLETRAQLETAKLHAGDQENLSLWKLFLPACIAEIETVYQRLGIHFDYQLGESFYHPMLGGLVEKLIASKQAVESDGAICIFLDGYDAPMLIRKRDGAFLYATTDLATIEYRMGHFSPDAILYVVDHRQSEHFGKLFAAARAIGFDKVQLHHISFGTVLGSDGKPFKTRSGTVIGLDYLLDEAIDRAYQAACNPDRLQKAGLEITEEEKRNIAEVVGLGAIKYADLSHNRTSDYEFNTEKMVQLEGNTSAYIQYSYARVTGIFRNSEIQIDEHNVHEFPFKFAHVSERNLALLLLQFEDALHQSVEEYYPSVLATYLFAVAKQFSSFFDQCPVIKADSQELRHSRLALCFATGRVLKLGLKLLGISVVPRM
ncbi:MAG: arginine--tRNA ligase [Pirellulaceae bacterium]|nr:arginine--tRNA ligase [Pirellulaceae bacterium]